MLTLFVCADGYYFLMKIMKISVASKEWMTKGIRGQALNCQGGEILKISKGGNIFRKSFWRGIDFLPSKGYKSWPQLQNILEILLKYFL